MQVRVSEQVNEVLEKALAIGTNRGQFYVGVEHLFAALLEEPENLPKCIQKEYLDRLYMVMREVARTAWTENAQGGSGEIIYTQRVIATTQAASKLAARVGHGAGAGHLLYALLADASSAPSRAMDQIGKDRGACLSKLQAELFQGSRSKTVPMEHKANPVLGSSSMEPSSPQPEMQLLDSAPGTGEAGYGNGIEENLVLDLTESARQGKLQPAVGRDAEILEILQILTRKTKNNVMLVGEAGVGKTQVAEGLALRIVQRRENDSIIPDFRILQLNLAALAAGTQYRGSFEEKVLALLEKLKMSERTVLFIDEAHLIMGAGSTQGDGMDLANLLKPAMARGEIRCIGATTLQEYRKFVEKDPAIERRFQMVRLEELSEDATLQVLARLRPSLERHHQVHISSRAIRAAVQLTQRYMPNRRQPDKSIDVLDHACARYRMKMAAFRDGMEISGTIRPDAAENKVTPHDIRKVVSQMTAIPIEEMTSEERMQLTDLDKRLQQRLIGQDEAVRSVVSAVKKSRAGLSDPNRPDAVMLFLGPSGVGKTQLAKLLATELFGAQNHLITFDMSEYIEEHSVSRLLGAPPGYAGCEEEGRLSAAVRNTPFCILLFDEIEKAHPRIFDIFLPIFDEGRLKDSHGREIVFRHCIIILTSNIGAEVLCQSNTEDRESELMDALLGHFRPEFINRIDEIVPFHPLLAEDVRSVLRLEVNALRNRLKERGIGVRMYQQAYEHLGEQGYNPEFGARNLRRTVDKLVATPISHLILEGKFKKGDMIDVKMSGTEIVFEKGLPHSKLIERGLA